MRPGLPWHGHVGGRVLSCRKGQTELARLPYVPSPALHRDLLPGAAPAAAAPRRGGRPEGDKPPRRMAGQPKRPRQTPAGRPLVVVPAALGCGSATCGPRRPGGRAVTVGDVTPNPLTHALKTPRVTNPTTTSRQARRRRAGEPSTRPTGLSGGGRVSSKPAATPQGRDAARAGDLPAARAGLRTTQGAPAGRGPGGVPAAGPSERL